MIIDCIYHELIEFFVIGDDVVVSERCVFRDHILRLRQLRVDPRQLVHRRGDPEARHVRRQQLLVQRVLQNLRLPPSNLPIHGVATTVSAAALQIGVLHHGVPCAGVDDLARVAVERRPLRVGGTGVEVQEIGTVNITVGGSGGDGGGVGCGVVGGGLGVVSAEKRVVEPIGRGLEIGGRFGVWFG